MDDKSINSYLKLIKDLKSKGFFNKKEEYSFLKFKLCLPYLFHIKNDTYEVIVESETAKLTLSTKHTERVEIKEGEKTSLVTKSNSPEIDKLINAELRHDSSGEFWYSEIDIEIPFTKKEIEFFRDKTKIPQDAVRYMLIIEKLFGFIDRFITCYRNSMFEPQIKELIPTNSQLIYLDEGETYSAISFFEQKLMSHLNSDKSYNIIPERIEFFLNSLKKDKPIPIWVDLMNNAHLYSIQNDFRMVMIECYITLESYIHEVIENFLPKKFNENLFKKFYKEKKDRLSLNDLYDQFAELCFDFSFKQNNPDLWTRFLSFKKVRNNIVHNKLANVEENVAEKCLDNTNKIINLFQKKRLEIENGLRSKEKNKEESNEN